LTAVVPLVELRPPAASAFPVESSSNVCSNRAIPIEPVVVQRGSRIAGYTTAASGHVTLTVQLEAPGAVTARPHGPLGSLSTAQPLTASAPSVRVPSEPTM
jgi:hypothetical protein